MTRNDEYESQLQAQIAIEHLIYSYCTAIDSGDLASLEELFRDATIMLASTPGRKRTAGQRSNGNQFARNLSKVNIRYPDGTFRTKHVVTNVTIDVSSSGNVASAHSYITVFQATEELPLQPIFVGRYEDTFECHAGTWHFASRLIHPDLIGNMRHHVKTAEKYEQ